jgi:hypothetical protein
MGKADAVRRVITATVPKDKNPRTIRGFFVDQVCGPIEGSKADQMKREHHILDVIVLAAILTAAAVLAVAASHY